MVRPDGSRTPGFRSLGIWRRSAFMWNSARADDVAGRPKGTAPDRQENLRNYPKGTIFGKVDNMDKQVGNKDKLGFHLCIYSGKYIRILKMSAEILQRHKSKRKTLTGVSGTVLCFWRVLVYSRVFWHEAVVEEATVKSSRSRAPRLRDVASGYRPSETASREP